VAGKRWFVEVSERGVLDVARAFGAGGRLKTLGPCPACSATRRGSADARLPVGSGDDRGWRCHACGAGGDGADWAAYATAGKRLAECSADQQKEVKTACVSKGLLDREEGADREGRPRFSPGRASVEEDVVVRRRFGASAPEPEPVVETEQPAPPRFGARVVVVDDEPDPVQAPAGRERWFSFRDGLADECAARLWDDPEAEEVRRYLTETRRVPEEVARAFGLGAYQGPDCWHLTIPLRDDDGVAVNLRFRRVDAGRPKYRVVEDLPLPLFGCDRLSDDLAMDLVLVEGEMDAIALAAYGWTANVVSTSAGAGCWKEEWTELLEPYTGTVYIAYDADEAGEKAAATVVEKVGRERCKRVKIPGGRKDFGECLAGGVQVEEVRTAIEKAEDLAAVRVVRFGAFVEALRERRANPEATRGYSTGLKALDLAIGGHRSELVVLTGDTGAGKSTFATFLAWERARMGEPVLVTSFEQRPVGTAEKLARMEIGGDFLRASEQDFEEAAARIDALPIYMVDHYGDFSGAKVLDLVKRYRRRYGIRHAMLDHLGFLTDDSGDDERQAIEQTIRALANLAVQEDITIHLMVHPSNVYVQQQRRVQISDCKGASAIKQDCRLGIAVERMKPVPGAPPTSTIHIDKCTSEFGRPGSSVRLAFDPFSCRYAERWEDLPAAKGNGKPGMLVDVDNDYA
jgi:KaiC/GvpD/RAD55 family RecA-like ATPase